MHGVATARQEQDALLISLGGAPLCSIICIPRGAHPICWRMMTEAQSHVLFSQLACCCNACLLFPVALVACLLACVRVFARDALVSLFFNLLHSRKPVALSSCGPLNPPLRVTGVTLGNDSSAMPYGYRAVTYENQNCPTGMPNSASNV